MFPLRVSASLLFAMLVAMLLIALMQSLVAMRQSALIPVEEFKFPPVVMPSQEVTEQDSVKPEPPVAVENEPPRIIVDETMPTLEGESTTIAYGQTWEEMVVKQPKIDINYLPVYVPEARFPRKAIAKRLGGYAVVKLVIAESGSVRNAELVEEHPTDLGFGSSALKAAERMRYNPKIVDGKPVEVHDVYYKYTFNKPDAR